jgi:hypothetical protein
MFLEVKITTCFLRVVGLVSMWSAILMMIDEMVFGHCMNVLEASIVDYLYCAPEFHQLHILEHK